MTQYGMDPNVADMPLKQALSSGELFRGMIGDLMNDRGLNEENAMSTDAADKMSLIDKIVNFIGSFVTKFIGGGAVSMANAEQLSPENEDLTRIDPETGAALDIVGKDITPEVLQKPGLGG